MTSDFEGIMNSISAMNLRSHGKFEKKLDFDQRCEVLALHRTGVSRSVLAEAYGLDRRTVTHIYNPKSPHYRNVREEEEKLGKEAFLRKYITENVLVKLKKVVDAMPAKKPPTISKAKRSATKADGVHRLKPEGSNKEHRIIIQWCEASIDNAGAGWYYRDMDGPDPTSFFHHGDESRASSEACLEAVKANLYDME